jgi:methionyl-tRNA formyltransferase
MRVAFFGNHTVGVRALEAIAASDEVVGVVCHPPDREDGVRYESVHDFACSRGWKTLRGKGRDDSVYEFVGKVRPDLLWITDHRYLIPPQLINAASQGGVNLHPSLLPKYRGRAPVNWAILQGESELGSTAHFVDEGMDSGDVIAQKRYTLSPEQDVGDALNLLCPLYSQVTREVLQSFHRGQVPRTPQDHSQATVFPRRTPEDGLIDWKKPAREVWNLVRAVAVPYPGAFSFVAGEKLVVWKARPATMADPRGVPGEILEIAAGDVTVRCGDTALLCAVERNSAAAEKLRPGMVLGA